MTREEAIEIIKRNCIPGRPLREACEMLIPELAESEDEKIRKELLEVIRHCYEDGGYALCTDDYKKYSAYLEKQKDSPMPEDTVVFQKGVAEGRRLEREDLPYWQTFKGIGIIVPDDYILAKFGKGYKLLRPGDTIEIGTEFLQVSQLDNLPKEEQQKEQKPRWEINNPHTTKWTKEMIDEKFEELVEKKHAEKQDYSGLTDLERAIHRGFLVAGVENVPRTIIEETAKDCLAQMKPAELSEEDEEKLKAICTYLQDYPRLAKINDVKRFNEYCDWLKSLRPQPHWKLSGEQMKILEKAVAFFKTEWTGTKIKEVLNLESLYEQLKSIQ